jgi:hypothetical protein
MAEPRKRIFISYKRDAVPDDPLANRIYEELRGSYHVFLDQKEILVGQQWAARIDEELRSSDYLIVLVSARSIGSDMLLGEVELAHKLKESQGHPVILPVRVAFRGHFEYPLSAYLNPINWARWDGEVDTAGLIEELSRSLSGQGLPIGPSELSSEPAAADVCLPPPLPAAQPSMLELPEGTMDPESKFYISRATDAAALQVIERKGVTLTIRGSRQMGKSSLLIRTLKRARLADKRTILLDFQLLGSDAVRSADVFFRQFCVWLTDELGIDDRVESYWNSQLGSTQRTTRYVGRHVLNAVAGSLVLAMDEVDSILEADFRTDFFAMLRSWHNSRAKDPIWNRLDLALVISTEPHHLIENLNQSPFNVGAVFELQDFSDDQVRELNRLHGNALMPNDLDQLIALIGSHPYLVRRALYLVASGQMSAKELFAQARQDGGPFGDHLRSHLFRLHGHKEAIRALLEVIRHRSCSDDKALGRLQGAGLVRREGSAVVPRCQLYADFFRERLHD